MTFFEIKRFENHVFSYVKTIIFDRKSMIEQWKRTLWTWKLTFSLRNIRFSLGKASCNQGSSGRRHPRRSDRGPLSLGPRSSWLVSKLLGYKAGIPGRKQGIWESRTVRTARTSTSCGGMVVIGIECFKTFEYHI